MANCVKSSSSLVDSLIDLTNDIKPYRTKILDVLIEYVQNDDVVLTIDETLLLDMDVVYNKSVFEDLCTPVSGYGIGFFDGGRQYIIDSVTAGTGGNGKFVIFGHVGNKFPAGSELTVQSKFINTIDNSFITTGAHNGVFTVVSTTQTQEFNNYLTIITVSETVLAIPPTPTSPSSPIASPSDITYIFTGEVTPIPVVGEIPYSNIINNPFNSPDESDYSNIGSNMFVIDGDYTSRFTQGVEFEILDGPNEGVYTTLYSDMVSGQTRIRPIQDIPNTSGGAGGQLWDIKRSFGYTSRLNATCNPAVASATIIDNLFFGWTAPERYVIVAVDADRSSGYDIVLVGDLTTMLYVGREIKLINTAGFNGTYTILGSSHSGGMTSVLLSPQPLIGSPIDTSPPTYPPNYGYVEIDVDIAEWFQYFIVDATISPQTITVRGDATSKVTTGTLLKVEGSSSNNGSYKALTVTYNGANSPPSNTTTIILDITADSIQANQPGGFIESYVNTGIRLHFTDSIISTVSDTGAINLSAEGGSLIGSWDYAYWDVQSWDENGGVLIFLTQ